MSRAISAFFLLSLAVPCSAQILARDANGDAIGLVSGQEQRYFSIVTPSQFTVRIEAESGIIQNDFVYFLQSDCLGPPYLAQTFSNAVIRNEDTYWHGNGTTITDVTFLSYKLPHNANCVNQNVPEPTGFEAVANEPLITGVPNGPFVAPFRIEAGSEAAPCIFADRFEHSLE